MLTAVDQIDIKQFVDTEAMRLRRKLGRVAEKLLGANIKTALLYEIVLSPSRLEAIIQSCDKDKALAYIEQTNKVVQMQWESE